MRCNCIGLSLSDVELGGKQSGMCMYGTASSTRPPPSRTLLPGVGILSPLIVVRVVGCHGAENRRGASPAHGLKAHGG